jgi:hypothetical protein
LVSTNDNDHRAGNNAATLAAVAAFGLSTAQEAAAQTAHGHAGPSSHSAPIMAPDTFSATQVASRDSGSEHSIAPHSAHGVASDHVMATTSLSSAGTQANTHGLAGQAHGGHEAVTQLLAGTESHAASHGPAPVTSAAIAIPSAQQLAAHMGHGADKAASVDAAAVHTDGAVAKVLADALAGGHGHGPNIDALLHNAATHGHAQDALAALASHDAGSVSNGHSGVFGGFHNAPIMEIMASHQDAMPAHS